MTTALQDKKDRRATLVVENRALLDMAAAAKRDLSAEEAAEYDRRDAEVDVLSDAIDRIENQEAREARLGRVDRTGVVADSDDTDAEMEARYGRVFDQFLVNGTGGLDPDDRRLLAANFSQDKSIRNAQGSGTPSAGGYLVPPEFRDKLIETQLAFGPMLQLAETITTGTGAQLPWPTNNDTANVGAILAENTQVTEQDVTLGTANIDAYMYTSKLVRVSFQLLQDRPDFANWLARKLGERLGRILNAHFTTGTGTAQPDGIVTSATVGVTSTGSFATTGGVSGDNLIDLVEALDPAYGGGNGLRFMMHQTARKAIRKLKDTSGQYLWQPSIQAGAPDQVVGYPISINNDMPTLAASSKSVLFGNIAEAYLVRLVSGIQTLRLEERYADYLQVGFLAFERADGTLQNGSAVRVLQTTATA